MTRERRIEKLERSIKPIDKGHKYDFSKLSESELRTLAYSTDEEAVQTILERYAPW